MSRLQELRLARGMIPAELAREAEMQQPTLSKIDLGQRGVSRNFAPKLAKALRVPVEALYSPIGAPVPDAIGPLADDLIPNARFASKVPPFPNTSAMPRDVPVYGAGQGGDDGELELNSIGQPIDWVRRAPGLDGMETVFAIYVDGDSMAPWRISGQFVYVHPTRPARPGDYVVVVLPRAEPGKPPKAFIKKLVRRTTQQIVVEQYNPPKELTFPYNEAVRVLRIIDWDEALGL